MKLLELPQVILSTGIGNTLLSPQLEETVEAIWQNELRRRPSLYNGQLFTIDRIEKSQTTGHYVEYRRFFAQWRKPELFQELQIRPLAVTAILRTEEGVLCGRRGAQSTQYPDIWELLPSGGVDFQSCRADGQLDLKRQILIELHEETGITQDQIEKITPTAFVYDDQIHLYNYGMELCTTMQPTEILERHAALNSQEHPELRLLTTSELGSFLTEQPPRLRELSRLFLTHSSLKSEMS